MYRPGGWELKIAFCGIWAGHGLGLNGSFHYVAHPLWQQEMNDMIGSDNTVMVEILQRVRRIEDALMKQASVKAAYTTAEFAKLVQRDEYTVREWCRLRRVNATKRACGRGSSQEWSLSHDQLVRYQSEGLLPIR
jgi:hypothetical protein